ncbi:MAG: hypothetical protein WBR15_02425 [Gammaproteobacteria bacterium]
MGQMYSLEELAAKPEYYLNEVDLGAGEYGFLKLDSKAYRRSVFMDHRLRSEIQDSMHVPMVAMEAMVLNMQTASSQAEPINYIFHTAFCCSTLISRCLDIEGTCYALREPSVLMQIANYKRAGNPFFTDGVRWETLLNTVLFLLAKSRGAGEIALIKPTNAANNLAEEIMGNPRTGGVLLLYSNLEQFLVSIIKKGEGGRGFVRKLFNVIRTDSERTSTLPVESLAQLTDLQIATFVWYLQMDAYLKLLARFPNTRIRTLDCNVFLAEPLEILIKLCDLFGIKIKMETLEEVVAGPVLKKYSKNDAQDYDSSVRETEYDQISREHQATIKSILAWSEQIRPEGPVRLPLPRAL